MYRQCHRFCEPIFKRYKNSDGNGTCKRSLTNNKVFKMSWKKYISSAKIFIYKPHNQFTKNYHCCVIERASVSIQLVLQSQFVAIK